LCEGKFAQGKKNNGGKIIEHFNWKNLLTLSYCGSQGHHNLTGQCAGDFPIDTEPNSTSLMSSLWFPTHGVYLGEKTIIAPVKKLYGSFSL
jgi:hypothetical protein